MFRKLGKWRVFGFYNTQLNDYVIMIRKNEKTGMLYFKTIKVAHTGSSELFRDDKIVFTEELYK